MKKQVHKETKTSWGQSKVKGHQRQFHYYIYAMNNHVEILSLYLVRVCSQVVHAAL